MATRGAWKTEHAGAKNGDKRLSRVEVKTISRKVRRQRDRALEGQDVPVTRFDRSLEEYLAARETAP